MPGAAGAVPAQEPFHHLAHTGGLGADQEEED